jgi:hypothetical protein
MIHGTKIINNVVMMKVLTIKNVVVIILNVVVNSLLSTTMFYLGGWNINDGNSYVVVNSISDGAFNYHGRPQFCDR